MNPFKAVSEGNTEALQAALGADPSLAGSANADGISLVRWALYQGRRDLAAVVLSHDPPLDVFDAASTGNAERLSKVVHHDRSLASARSSDGFTPLHFAAFLGTAECAAVLLGVGADPAAVASGAMTVQPLHSAAASGNVEVARLLLDARAPVDATQSGGFTPLHEAAHRGNVELVDLLLARGADITITNDAGQTAADLADAGGHAELATRLRPT
jgi:ankyrin repeat protein